ncbi:hypothetical protein CCMA1212_010153 [Trichoderma ghanense]|uniref:Uncharacterized protein n=1 Tax=Trichoderma ghanense TaxID=65468 RepID=A0ABY2GRB6_9HYPO
MPACESRPEPQKTQRIAKNRLRGATPGRWKILLSCQCSPSGPVKHMLCTGSLAHAGEWPRSKRTQASDDDSTRPNQALNAQSKGNWSSHGGTARKRPHLKLLRTDCPVRQLCGWLRCLLFLAVIRRQYDASPSLDPGGASLLLGLDSQRASYMRHVSFFPVSLLGTGHDGLRFRPSANPSRAPRSPPIGSLQPVCHPTQPQPISKAGLGEGVFPEDRIVERPTRKALFGRYAQPAVEDTDPCG